MLFNLPSQADTSQPKSQKSSQSQKKRQLNPLMKDEEEIPSNPSAPPNLGREIPVDNYPCKRRFIYRGKALMCDSNIERDAERLRVIMSDVPAAVAEIDAYQATRRKIRLAAYTATAGVALYLAGSIITSVYMPQSQGLRNAQSAKGYEFATSRIIGDPNSDQETTRNTVRRITRIGGLGLAGASILGTVILLGENESRIRSAVSIFNVAHPESPIELQFSTGFSF